ncbi:hypothetical protein ABMX64_22475 [Vibrio vulnificus]|uniref:hypothetical protein n=1 Tax=Vibrio vulnificus TaxID=672 RepID=UPI003E10D572|nr:hypothetical protein [Vibrio vulnificus]
MSKIGEQNVQGHFTRTLDSKLNERYKKSHHYSRGELNGKLDKLYADYFAQVGTMCVLIEFKEFETEVKSEKKKPLRKKLCVEIPEEFELTSYDCHFVSWRLDEPRNMSIRLDRYISKVCPLFDIDYDEFELIDGDDFIDGLLNEEIGSDYYDFIEYLDYLASLEDGSTPPSGGGKFGGVLYIVNKALDRMLAITYNSLTELLSLKKEYGLYSNS